MHEAGPCGDACRGVLRWSDGLAPHTPHIVSLLIPEPEIGSTSIYACDLWAILLQGEVRLIGYSGLPSGTESSVMQEVVNRTSAHQGFNLGKLGTNRG
jgi:hypothetical protein